MPIEDIRPSPENDELYRPIAPADPDIVALAESVREYGLREPIVLTLDRYILSGHRRYAACGLAGLLTVPCRYEPINRTEDRDRFLTLLREFNRQRTKSFDETVREEILDITGEDAYQTLRTHRREKAAVSVETVDLGEKRIRNGISAAKMPMVEALREIIHANQSFWPLSVRQCHYLLLNVPPLKHARKPGSRYRNDRKSYADLCDVALRARLEGFIPLHAIDDATRPVTIYNVFPGVRGYVSVQLDDLLKYYARDLMQSQPMHLELVGEKNTLANVLRPIAMEYTIPLTLGRGFCSFPPLRDMAARFEKSGKERLTVIVVSDFDPEGESIPAALGRTLRDDLAVENATVIKAALDASQIKRFSLPSGGTAKKGSSRYDAYVDKHGTTNVWELESLSPTDLQTVVRQALEGVIDREAFAQEVEAEKNDAADIARLRRRVMAAIAPEMGGPA